jgi:hypothetical protein
VPKLEYSTLILFCKNEWVLRISEEKGILVIFDETLPSFCSPFLIVFLANVIKNFHIYPILILANFYLPSRFREGVEEVSTLWVQRTVQPDTLLMVFDSAVSFEVLGI